ncbi:hypothetical protein VCRA2117O380_90124 [Vibrio crassostreae]|nr:hypothetical protein VCRA2119O381_160019 [Vibrio crassostreae]CAK2239850.1 hypothetical protein VCRA2117O379_90124 [Vibrio crassostreae]CAK2241314.1 hypothetical protein VCRA2119O382_90123 [Vibrio crassostreae]CAK2246805.1 hypothetical protein VCRA2117O380_90124 [Vibrio crassostreae]CAK2393850.1 hypothetical protein VCRA2113O350_100088 [Vibrio crassostreae]
MNKNMNLNLVLRGEEVNVVFCGNIMIFKGILTKLLFWIYAD